MFLFRVRNTYSVIALCREEIDECEGRRERAVLSRETGRKSSRHLPALTAAPDNIFLSLDFGTGRVGYLQKSLGTGTGRDG